MRPQRLYNLGLAVLLVLSLGLHWALRRDPARANPDLFPDMVRTLRYNAFSPNPHFADGATLQAPDPRAIPRDLPPLPYQPNPEDALRAGQTLQNPLSTRDLAALERGRAVFGNFCQPCHGPAGRGDGPVVSRGFPAPPPLTRPQTVALPDGRLFHIVTYGQGNMAPHGSQLSREDRWKAILFIRSLQRQAGAGAQGGPR
ncbi:MAG: cytochrome c [Candidatus Methylomirabilales bacterium]